VQFEANPCPLRWELLVLIGLILCAFGISLFVNVNRFSLHALYRNRLVRAFLGSARGRTREPDPFTGFDPKDNPRLAGLAPQGCGGEPERGLQLLAAGGISADAVQRAPGLVARQSEERCLFAQRSYHRRSVQWRNGRAAGSPA
jgi:hypothetical protein